MSTITLTGVGKSCQTGKWLAGTNKWSDVRENHGGGTYYNKDPETADLYVQDQALLTTIKRFGILFNTDDVVALGDIEISSVSLRLYCKSSSSNVGTVIYSAPWTFAITGTYDDYCRTIGAYRVLATKPFDHIVHSLTTSQGYNTFVLGTSYVSSQEYTNMVSYGVGEYEHDYLDVDPSTSTIYELEFSINEMVTSGSLVAGALYMITDNSGADFTTAGAANNDVGTVWTYTSGSVTWGTGELYKNPPQLIITYTSFTPTATSIKTTFII